MTVSKFINIKDHLLKLGFSEKEAVAFLTLVRIGATAASVLARLTQIKRTSIYDILNSLENKGAIASFRQGKTQLYYAEDTKKLVIAQKEKLKIAHKLVENLKNTPPNAGLQISYYKGSEGVKELYNDILEAKPKELLGWVDLDHFYRSLDPEFERKWTENRVASGIKVRLLMRDSKLAQKFKNEDPCKNRETRLINKENAFTSTCFLYEPFIVYFDTKGDVIGVRLQNPEFFQMQKTIFEMNWAISK
ncbi:hypothetical protein IPG41_03785 [Candidatus Peregrinibacteria bacterium]|nr:MAG: hypothetical protein IPG41_03785 [Candidatus Peregrinibacteria bacterium]